MKYFTISLLFTFLFAGNISCNKFDNCDGVICFTPPQRFYLEIVDKVLGQNLYSTDRLLVEDISLKNESGEAIEVNFITEEGINLINISAIGWVMEAHTYNLKLSDKLEIEIELEMQEKHENCCTFFDVVHFDIPGYDFERLQYSEIIKIEIEL